MTDPTRFCAKLFSPEPAVGDEIFVPIFHRWIRARRLDDVLIDVADYSHVPDGPGVMLVGHAFTLALDRADGRFGLAVQRRRGFDGDAVDSLAATLAALFAAADALEHDAPDIGLALDRARVRVEINDRLLAANDEAGFIALRHVFAAAARQAFPGRTVAVARVPNDPRSRLTVDLVAS